MAIPSSLALLIATSLCAPSLSASAQSTLTESRVRRIESPVRDGGILHLATNTWTRRPSSIGLGADVVYDNTIASGYFLPLSGDTVVDEGRIPSPTSPTTADSRPGCATAYSIDGFQIAYCTDQPAPQQLEVAFYETYVACSTTVGAVPTASFLLGGLPGLAGTGASSCWTITVDLDLPPPGSAFTMLADGDGAYSPPADANLFGWSIRSTAPAAQLSGTGPVVAGDPGLASRYDGTRWDNPVNYAEAGTGMGTLDQFRNEGPTTAPGCYLLGGGSFASFHLELYSDACACIACTTGVPFCSGDGTGTPCPCGNNGTLGAGCANSLGHGARLSSSGASSISNDTVLLVGNDMPPGSSCLYFQGTIRQNAGNGVMFGDGKRCAGGSVVRLGISANTATGSSRYPRPGDPRISARGMITGPGSRTYQAWYRNAASFCTSATFNLTNGVEILWGA